MNKPPISHTQTHCALWETRDSRECNLSGTQCSPAHTPSCMCMCPPRLPPNPVDQAERMVEGEAELAQIEEISLYFRFR